MTELYSCILKSKCIYTGKTVNFLVLKLLNEITILHMKSDFATYMEDSVYLEYTQSN